MHMGYLKEKEMLLLLITSAVAAAAVGPYNRYVFPNEGGLAKFTAARFGLFVHWGPVAQSGDEISFPLTCGSFPCTVQGANRSKVVISNRDELIAHRAWYHDQYKTFNPTAFSATALADLAFGAGFRYLTWIATHCDGFSMWASTANKAYSIMATPIARDLFQEARAAFLARGLRVGVYVCPSFWNNDNYWAPNASYAFGGCCEPNYQPADYPARWSAFVDYLHGELVELAQLYQPSHYWIDSGTYTPEFDTDIESIVPALRAANPEVVLQVRDGGVFRDYTETPDHSEEEAHNLMGVSYLRPGDAWETPGTLGEQWAYDPTATYKDAVTVIRSLLAVSSKGGNFLLNIGPDASGRWAPAAVATLVNMSQWCAYSCEAVHNTSVLYPYEFTNAGQPFQLYFSQSLLRNSSYVSVVPTSAATSSSTLTISFFKPSTLTSAPTGVALLTASGPQPLNYTFDETGLSINTTFLVSVPVSLRTYRKRYSGGGGASSERPHVGSAGVPWWKKQGKQIRKGSNGRSSGVTGSPRLYNVDANAAVSDSTTYTVALPTLEDNAPCGSRDCAVYVSAGYALVREEGTCFSSQTAAATVPVYLFWNGFDDNMGASSAPSDGQDWSKYDTECWAYATPGPNRVPLDIWHNAALGDYWTLSADASRAEAQAQNYTLFRGAFAYVDAAPPSDIMDEESIAAATVASYAYVLRFDWVN